MAVSTKETIELNLKAAIEKLTTANGYDTSLANVFSEEIPQAIALEEYELPAVLMIAGDDNMTYKTKCIFGEWHFELQLIHNMVDDKTMHRFVRDVLKVIFADSPTAARNDAWRTLSPKVYDVRVRSVESDLNMIEANRFFIVNLVVFYQTKPHDL